MLQRDKVVTIKSFSQAYLKPVALIHACVIDGWSEKGLEADLENSLSHSFVLVDEEEKVLAFCSFSVCGEAELSFVCTHPSKRQNGYAYTLLKETIEQLEAKIFGLEVRKENKSAIKLYEKLGFKELGIRKGMYQHPADDAVVMQLVKSDL